MKKVVIALVLALALVLSLVGVAAAITNGQPDGNDHPYVGLAVFFDEDWNALWRCSASLIESDLVLTAGHCVEPPAAHARIWFDEKVSVIPVCPRDDLGNYIPGDCYPYGGGDSYTGTPYLNPNYRSPENPYGGGNGLPAFSYRDVGVILLDEELDLDVYGYAELPAPGYVDTLKNKTAIDFVGYGVQEQIMLFPGQLPRARWTGLRNRMYAPSELVSGKFVHSAEYMRFALNAGGGSGGTCFGDSGGPDLLRNTNIVLAVNSYVTNVNCSGVGYSARVDIPEILDWIIERQFLDN